MVFQYLLSSFVYYTYIYFWVHENQIFQYDIWYFYTVSLFPFLLHLQVIVQSVSREHWQGDGHIKVRVGNEKIGQTFGNILTTNNMCGRFDLSNKIVGNQVNVSCNATLFGRYLSIQKKAFGVLEIDEVYYHPPPSRFLV